MKQQSICAVEPTISRQNEDHPLNRGFGNLAENKLVFSKRHVWYVGADELDAGARIVVPITIWRTYFTSKHK